MPMKWDSAMIAKARVILGDVDDSKLTAILELDPSLEEIEEAVLKVQGLAGLHRHDEWPLRGKAGLIFDILSSELDDESRGR